MVVGYHHFRKPLNRGYQTQNAWHPQQVLGGARFQFDCFGLWTDTWLAIFRVGLNGTGRICPVYFRETKVATSWKSNTYKLYINFKMMVWTRKLLEEYSRIWKSTIVGVADLFLGSLRISRDLKSLVGTGDPGPLP